VTITYRIDPKNREAFLEAIQQAGRERWRDGAYDWRVFEDPRDNRRFIETFLSDSWVDHLRQHERLTKADQVGSGGSPVPNRRWTRDHSSRRGKTPPPPRLWP
jgi:hypothetical protein